MRKVGRLSAPDVQDDTAEAMARRLQYFEDSVGDRLELVSAKARRNQNYPRVLGIRRNSFLSNRDEVDHVRGYDRPPFPYCIGELGAVVELDIARLKGTYRVDALLPKQFGNGG